MAVRLSALRAGRSLPPGRFLVLVFHRGWVDPSCTQKAEVEKEKRTEMKENFKQLEEEAAAVTPRGTATHGPDRILGH
jgi:hypothetical protein